MRNFYSQLLIITLCLCLLPDLVQARTSVGFLFNQKDSTKPFNLVHVFISNPDARSKWVHSYPPEVARFDAFEEHFRGPTKAAVNEIEIYTIEDLNIPSRFIDPEIGKPFQEEFLWEVPYTTYCSKFVGLLLGLKPKPNKDNPHRIGISPKDIYEYVTNHPNFFIESFHRSINSQPFQKLEIETEIPPSPQTLPQPANDNLCQNTLK